MSLDWFCPPFKEYQREKTSTYILKPCLEIGQSFEESLREGKLVKSLEIFEWIIELYDYQIRLPYDVKYYADLEGEWYPPRPITSSSICIILHILYTWAHSITA